MEVTRDHVDSWETADSAMQINRLNRLNRVELDSNGKTKNFRTTFFKDVFFGWGRSTVPTPKDDFSSCLDSG
jgi:hypothetical protein